MIPYTRGPWTVLSRSVVPEDGLAICELPKRSAVVLGTHGLRKQEAIDAANLRLIAAAPRLLEIMQAIAEYPGSDPGIVVAARAAVAEALGESK